jgi:Protein of unknown function (DUF992)
MRKFPVLAIAAVASVAISISVVANASAAEMNTKVGYLSCQVSKGWGIVFGSSRDLACTYTPLRGNREVEHYKGSINKFGADIGYLKSGVILWAVVAPSKTVKPGALAGNYAGATASITPGYGGGVNALVGGMDKSIALQPVSIEGDKGLNVAAGVSTINLDYVPKG